MEDVWEVYHLPYDPDYPLVCMDESCKHMVGEVRQPITCKLGQPARIDDEYVRNGVAEIFMEVEPLAGNAEDPPVRFGGRGGDEPSLPLSD